MPTAVNVRPQGRLLSTAAMLLALSTILFLPAPSAEALPGAGTITYVQDSNIWITTPDGARRHQVTTDGTPSDPWESPSMDDHGVILAARGTHDAQLVRMTQSGQVLSAFTPTVVLLSGMYQVEVAADGELAAYSTLEPCQDSGGFVRTCSLTEIVYADGRSPDSLGGIGLDPTLTWFPGRDTVVVSAFKYFNPGDEDDTPWFFTEMDPNGISFPRHADWVAAAGCDFKTGGFGCVQSVGFWQVDGPPPPSSGPGSPADNGVQHDCRIVEEDLPDAVFSDVSVAPDGDAVVYSVSTDGSFDPATSVIKMANGFSPSPCEVEGFTTLVEGATEPFWSAAAYDPTGNPGGGPGTPGPDVVRVDGGGAADPVGQAIETSRALFDDAGADRVVLATADRFPDALAGAPLAGDDGPILLTPFGASLDPRVQAEITRVTGGSGMVLVLGGAGAVSDSAAAQARAAAGDLPCEAPFPTSCRYAGAGREETAALIAATVLAEHPGGQALLARGDAFADAITGGAYAAVAGVPILLTPTSSLNATTSDFIAQHGLAEVVVLGGPAAVSDAAVAAVPAPTRRIAGADRTATAAAIATELWLPAGRATGGVILINARSDQGWQTALTGAVMSARLELPQLAVEAPPAAPGQATLDAAARIGGGVVVLGGADLVSDAQAAAVDAAAS